MGCWIPNTHYIRLQRHWGLNQTLDFYDFWDQDFQIQRIWDVYFVKIKSPPTLPNIPIDPPRPHSPKSMTTWRISLTSPRYLHHEQRRRPCWTKKSPSSCTNIFLFILQTGELVRRKKARKCKCHSPLGFLWCSGRQRWYPWALVETNICLPLTCNIHYR